MERAARSIASSQLESLFQELVTFFLKRGYLDAEARQLADKTFVMATERQAGLRQILFSTAEQVSQSAERSHAPLKRADDLDAEVRLLYEEIDRLHRQQRDANTDDLEATIAQKMERLRQLQNREAQRFRDQFESRLEMPIDAGRRILEQARKLRRRFEDSAAAVEPAS